MFGKSIRIYLADATPSGLRHIEIVNWSGQALACPRIRLSELKSWSESQRPGIYFLFEQHSTDDRNRVYIGESEDVYKRLSEQERDKDFWNELILFTSKDENLTKGHIKYLESRITQITKEVNKYDLENGNRPKQSNLPKADMDAMEEFIHNTKIILGALGHKFLVPINSSEPISSDENVSSLAKMKLHFTVNKVTAYGRQSDDGFILLKNSQISIKTNVSMPGKIKLLKQRLISEKNLIQKENHYVLTKDIILSSSSYAADLVAGSSRSGPQSWKNEQKMTLKKIEAQLINN